MNDNRISTPWHLWVIGIIALLWNAVGAFDYLATKLQYEAYMSAFSQEQLDYFYGLPTWVVACWAVGVWGALLGSLALLLRKAWAVWLFGASILGMAGTTIHNFVLTDGAAVMGEGATTFSIVIWVIALFLYFYSAAMAKRRVLT
ncbi:MAG: hypothetical protein P8Y52_12925 [Xanthomonadales bacterium]